MPFMGSLQEKEKGTVRSTYLPTSGSFYSLPHLTINRSGKELLLPPTYNEETSSEMAGRVPCLPASPGAASES